MFIVRFYTVCTYSTSEGVNKLVRAIFNFVNSSTTTKSSRIAKNERFSKGAPSNYQPPNQASLRRTRTFLLSPPSWLHLTLLKHQHFQPTSVNPPAATTQSFLLSSIEPTPLPNLNLHHLLQPQDLWSGTMRRFVAADDRVVAQQPLHKPADVPHAASKNRRNYPPRRQFDRRIRRRNYHHPAPPRHTIP